MTRCRHQYETVNSVSRNSSKVRERRLRQAMRERDIKCRRKYVAGALECETDEQIASNLLEGQIRHQPQILDLSSRHQV